MSVELTQEDVDIFNLNGVPTQDIQRKVDELRGLGYDDEAVQNVLNSALDVFRPVTPYRIDSAGKIYELKYNENHPKNNSEKIFNVNQTTLMLFGIIGVVIFLLFLITFIKFAVPFVKKLPRKNYHILGYITFLYLAFIICAANSRLDYGYYEILRWLVTSFSVWSGYKIYVKDKQSRWVLTFGAIAILFNPVIKITLDKDLWQIIDIIVLILFLSYAIKYRKKVNLCEHFFKK